MRDAVANGIRYHSMENARNFLEHGPIPDGRFGTVAAWMASKKFRYVLEHRTKGLMQKDTWVMRQERGVFLDILVGVDRVGEEVEQVVEIYSDAKEVLDCCEEKEFFLGWVALRACVGSCSYRGIR